MYTKSYPAPAMAIFCAISKFTPASSFSSKILPRTLSAVMLEYLYLGAAPAKYPVAVSTIYFAKLVLALLSGLPLAVTPLFTLTLPR